MAQEFFSDSTGSDRPNSDAFEPQREKVQFMIISSREGVQEQIRNFYVMGFAQVDEWGPLTPAPNSDRVMTILVRYRKVGSTDS
ncbi:hypothetical protein [Microseira sp. BLCC-F43]|jgi:hypothetical protein|uniref:hypothetical protein n=1 Tax=Microseira sp. BLCC-F43 TaxID=3153602 RepID=UPI0035B9E090